jgi:prepilin-type N-terminal cleavage/methylation domain-containing protein
MKSRTSAYSKLGPRSAAEIETMIGQVPAVWRNSERISMQAFAARSASGIALAGFTILELLVAVAILALMVVMFSSLLSSASSVTTLSNKHTEADAQARAVFDRMAIDFARMVKRPDVDYFLKSSTNLQTGQDQMAFYSEVAGYYPSSGSQSPLSLVGYRINGAAGLNQNKLQRLGYGLLWNGVSSTNRPAVFLPLTIAATWPTAANLDADDKYELLGPQVFRFEYYYILRGQTLPDGTVLPSILSDTPWDTRMPGHVSADGLRDVAAIGVAIAVIDPRSKVLVTDDQVETLAETMKDFSSDMKRGDLEAQWQTAVNAATGMPRASASSIRIYGRHFYIKPSL